MMGGIFRDLRVPNMPAQIFPQVSKEGTLHDPSAKHDAKEETLHDPRAPI